MNWSSIKYRISHGVALAAFVALSLVHFAHSWHSEQTYDPALQTYLASGGQLSDVCNLSENGEHGLGETCEACVIVAGFALPLTSGFDLPVVRVAKTAARTGVGTVQLSFAFDLSRASRAPPVHT
ncbi:MAG: hypothetical protein ABJL72_19335 [Roseobacter sp.]